MVVVVVMVDVTWVSVARRFLVPDIGAALEAMGGGGLLITVFAVDFATSLREDFFRGSAVIGGK